MKTIDSFGEMCPIPVLRIEEEIKSMEPGESFMIVVDHSCVVRSIEDKYKDGKIDVQIDEVMNGVWEIVVTRR
ncbi:MAG: sulfurtransferase TusA family protein [Clostridia bacterium]|nr:sulfurtransferase TusA family protein [Clostridia bacterium]